MKQIYLTDADAKLILISLKARCSRLRNKRKQVSSEARPPITADINRTKALFYSILQQFPQSDFKGLVVTNDVTPYQKALCDHAEEMSGWLLGPNN